MNEQRKYKLKRILRITLWSSAGIALFVLLLSAMQRNKVLVCSATDIVIEGYNHEMYISDEEVKQMLETQLTRKIKGVALAQLDLRKLERSLLKNPWISKAQLYLDNQQVLHVNIGERMPVARIFTIEGQSFYMDSSAVVLPLSINETADVPVFTNVPNGVPNMAAKDSIVWQQISSMGNFIKHDTFLLMQLGQIDYKPNGVYTMYPAIGNHVIEFGTTQDYEQKLKRLAIFYKRIFGKVGLNKYETIDLRYSKQIVATLRGKPEGRIDSAAAMRNFEALVNRTVREANDTTVNLAIEKNNKVVQELLTPKSLQPVDRPTENQIVAQHTAPEQAPQQPAKSSQVNETLRQNKPIINTQKPKPMVAKQTDKLKPTVIKDKPKPAVTDSKQPRAIMPKQNDY